MSNAPAQIERVIGREAQLRELRAALERGHVVIIGPPGVGKTTLARQLCSETERALFCDLTDARTIDGLVGEVASTLGLEPRPGVETESERRRIVTTVDQRGLELVVLDNFDHVSQHGPAVARWLQNTPCRLVVTSRRPVALSGAHTLEVEPLGADDAVRLFARRATEADPTFSLDANDDATVRRLVERLDRLPLAVELAAARAHVLTPEQILERIDDRLQTLTDHRTGRSLGGALEWSWELLAPPEQSCLAQCSVLQGEFTVSDAEAIVRIDGMPVLDAIDRLVVDGWLTSRRDEASGQPILNLYESIRDFASTKLEERDRTEIEAAYATHLTRWAERLASQIETPDGLAAFEAMVAREGALRWAVEFWLARDRAEAARLLTALTYPILLHSRVVDFADGVRKALDLAAGHELGLTVRLLQLDGQMRLLTRKFAAAEEALRRAHALAEQTNDLRLQFDAARTLAIAIGNRQPSSAVELLEDALATATTRSADPFVIARLRERLGFAYNRLFRLTEAYDAFEDAHDALLRVGNPLFLGESLSGLGYIAWRRGDLEGARSAFSEAVQVHERSGNRTRTAAARFNLGTILHAVGRTDDAAHQYELALEDWDALGLTHYRPAVWTKLALVECEVGTAAEARRLAKAARAAAADANDVHNQGLAEGVVAFTRVREGREVDVSALDLTLTTLNMGADPIAVAAHLALLAGSVDDRATREHLLSRIDEVRSLASEEDVHVEQSLLAIDRLARGLAGLVTIESNGDADEALGFVRAAVEFADHPYARNSPYTRLLAGWLASRCEEELAAGALSTQRRLLVHPQAHWFQLDGDEVVDLTTRKPLRLLLAHFVAQALEDPLASTPVAELIAVGWPGERVSESAGKNRVYTAIRFLREMGLEGILVTGDRGYRLSPDVRVETASQAAARP